MSKSSFFQIYSTPENVVTNNTLQLFSRINSYSTAQASKLLTEITGEPIEIGVEINQQKHERESVPDGAIIQRSFKILIESKVDSSIDPDQLEKHTAGFGNEKTKILLLLTKEKIDNQQEKAISKKVTAVDAGVIFKNVSYEEICTAIEGIFKDYEFEMRALVQDYIEYCNDEGLSDQSKHLMRVVPCGKSINLNRKYAMYYQPSDRGYTRHSFIGIYTEKRVQFLFLIDSVFDIKLSDNKIKKTFICGRETDDYDQKIKSMIKEAKSLLGSEVGKQHKFFCGKKIFDTDYVKESFGGMQNARYVNLKKTLGAFSDVEDIAHQLRGKQW